MMTKEQFLETQYPDSTGEERECVSEEYDNFLKEKGKPPESAKELDDWLNAE